VKLKPNKHFALPTPDRDIIMIGPGTGIAPFRAFVQERRATGGSGRAWLFFGDRSFTHDFLYQLEWQDALADKSLTRMDIAFSRDQSEKVYVPVNAGVKLYQPAGVKMHHGRPGLWPHRR
jgi:sulfite reductase (NADPH) flavoprotein alpha-component